MSTGSEEAKLKRRALDLLRRDEEFRYAVAGYLGISDVIRRMDSNEEAIRRLVEEVKALREGQEKLWEENRKIWEEVKALREGQEKLWEEVRALRRDFRTFSNSLNALGARWGMMTEEAFREGMSGILSEMGLSVERWTHRDEEGYVYGYRSEVEVDVAIRDGELILVEVKSHVGMSDVSIFRRKAELYGRVTGRTPSRLAFVSPYVDQDAEEACRELGIDVYRGG